MNTDDLAMLGVHVSTIDGERPERLGEVHERIRTARRHRAAAAVSGTVALTAAVIAAFIVMVSVVTGSSEHSAPPVNSPLPTVKPVEEPHGQTELTATFGPEDLIHGNVAIGSATSKPGATELHMNLPFPDTENAQIVGFCQGSEDIWWVSTGTYGQCSPDAPLEVSPPVEFQPGGNAAYPLPGPDEHTDQEIPVDVWLTEPLSARARHCIDGQVSSFTVREECLDSDPGVTLLTSADATFGFTAYVHSAPLVVENPFDRGSGFEALANVEGTDYVFTRGVSSAPGADQLAMYLGPSEQSRLVVLVQKRWVEDQPPLLVDGEPAAFPTDLVPGSPWQRYLISGVQGLVPPGSHNVTVNLPRSSETALLVYEAQSPE